MEIERIDDLNKAEFAGTCTDAVIKGSRLMVSARCDAYGKDWKGFSVSYNYKVEEDKEIYLIKADSIEIGPKFVRMRVSIDLTAFPFRATNWLVSAVYSEDGEYYSSSLLYKPPEKGFFDFVFPKDYFNADHGNIVFVARSRDGYLALRYREKGRYDGIGTRIKEYIARSRYTRHKEEYQARRVYLIYEKRCRKAQDNGYHLFKYCMENGMEEYLGAKIYYVMEEDAPDMRKLTKYKDNVLPFMSYKFMNALLSANLLISPDARAHAYSWQPVKSVLANVIRKKKHVFLGHGVLALKRLNESFSASTMQSVLSTVTSEQEADIVANELGFARDTIAITGYARFDALEDRSDEANEILMMPTHRSWLFGVGRDVFTASEYYKNYMDILNSDELISLLEEKDMTLSFYVHPSIREQRDAFHSKSDRIKVIRYEDISLDDLMMRCKMLVTDYSSICWDVYYMGKPTVFYQYDPEKYMETWGSYVDLRKDLPGERTEDREELLSMIREYADNGFKLKEEYEKHREATFAFLDTGNSKRICEELRKRNY